MPWARVMVRQASSGPHELDGPRAGQAVPPRPASAASSPTDASAPNPSATVYRHTVEVGLAADPLEHDGVEAVEPAENRRNADAPRLEQSVEPHLVFEREHLGVDAFAPDDESRGRSGLLGVDEPCGTPAGLAAHRDDSDAQGRFDLGGHVVAGGDGHHA